MKQKNWEFSEGADRLLDNTASRWSFPTFSTVEKAEKAPETIIFEGARRASCSAGKEVGQDRWPQGDPGTHMVAAKNQLPRINLSISTRKK